MTAALPFERYRELNHQPLWETGYTYTSRRVIHDDISPRDHIGFFSLVPISVAVVTARF